MSLEELKARYETLKTQTIAETDPAKRQ